MAFQLPVSLPLQKFCLQNTSGRRPDSFSTPEDRESDIDGVVNHRDWIMATLTQLSLFLFPLIYPVFIFFSWAGSSVPYHGGLPVWVGLSPYLDLCFFVVILAILSYSFICSLQYTHWDFPNNTLQPCPTPLPYILGWSHLMCSTDSCTRLAQSRLAPA